MFLCSTPLHVQREVLSGLVGSGKTEIERKGKTKQDTERPWLDFTGEKGLVVNR